MKEEKIMKYCENIIVKLSKEQQAKMLNFFIKTSIPRMLQHINKEIK